MSSIIQRTQVFTSIPLFFLANPENSRKRRHFDDEESDRNGQSEPVQSLEQTIFRLADKHPSLTVEEDIQKASELIVADIKGDFAKKDGIVDSLCSCIIEMPHKQDAYIQLLKSLAEHEGELTILHDVYSRISSIFTASLCAGGQWRHALQAVRFFSGLVQVGMLPQEIVGTFIGSALLAISNPNSKVITIDFLLWLCGQALLITGNFPVAGDFSVAVEKRKTLANALPKDLTLLLSLLSDAPMGIATTNSIAADAAKLSLPSIDMIQVDCHWDGEFQVLPIVEYEGVSPKSLYEAFLCCRVLIESLEFNHRRCADVLMNGFPHMGEHHPKILSQLLFSELLRNRTNRFPSLVYETLLMDCCRISRSFPPAMAKCVNAIYSKLDELGYSVADRLASWFAHHLSNFEFKWNWNAWSEVLDAPPTSMQYVFVRFTLDKLIRLSYREKLQKLLPDTFHGLLPVEPLPCFKFAIHDGQMAEGDAELASTVSNIIAARQSPEDVKAALGTSTGNLDSSQKEILLQSLLNVGSRSLSHMLSVTEKYLSLFQLIATDASGDRAAGNYFILDQLCSFWQNSPLHFEFIVERLVNYRVLLPRPVVQWIVQKADEQLCDPENSFFVTLSSVLSRNFILRTVQQAHLMPRQAIAKLRGQSEEKINQVVSNLRKEFEDTLTVLLEKLTLLPVQVAATETIITKLEIVCRDLVGDLLSAYPDDAASVAKTIIDILGSGGIKSVSIKALLSQAYLKSL